MNPLDSIVRQQEARHLAAKGKLPNRSGYVFARYKKRRGIPDDQKLTDEQMQWAIEEEIERGE